MNIGTEILINASLITHDSIIETYEFIIDNCLTIKDSIKVKNLPPQDIKPAKVVSLRAKHNSSLALEADNLLDSNNPLDPDNFLDSSLDGMLFELNHVRVNPHFNNEAIIKQIIGKLKEVGISITESAASGAISMRFKPFGEINSSVRFYVSQDNTLVFLSPMQPKLVCYSS